MQGSRRGGKVGRAVGTFSVLALVCTPVVVLAGTTTAGAATMNFTTPGTTDFVVPGGVTCLDVTAWGADGGQGGGSIAGGLGGRAESTLSVVPGETVHIDVGGHGSDASAGTGGAGGVNGGGKGGDGATSQAGGGGGGMSDIRVGSTPVIIAGGGGGGGGTGGTGGSGGDTGTDGSNGGTATGGKSGGNGGAAGTSVGTQTGQATAGGSGTGGAGADSQPADDQAGGGGGAGATGGGGGGASGGGAPSGGGGGGGGTGFTVLGNMANGIGADNDGDGEVDLGWTVGDTDCIAAPVTITKSTTGGAAAPGTTFAVTLSCGTSVINPGTVGQPGIPASSVTVTFVVDAGGVAQPQAGFVVGFFEPGICQVTETGTGGATAVSYACTSTPGTGAGSTATDWTHSAAVVAPGCVSAGPQSTPIGVNIVNENQTAHVTVTNTIPVPVAAPVVIQPAFAG